MTVDDANARLRERADKALDEVGREAFSYLLGSLAYSQPRAVLDAVEMWKKLQANPVN